jgi:hypothetical protein
MSVDGMIEAAERSLGLGEPNSTAWWNVGISPSSGWQDAC